MSEIIERGVTPHLEQGHEVKPSRHNTKDGKLAAQAERIAALEAALSSERERADRLAELLDAGSPYFAHTILFDEVGSALAAHRQARGE